MTLDEYGSYFFSVIQRSPGQPADDYAAVLGASTIPAGLGPYVVPEASMPHHALTQQIGSDGRIAGRMFLPTAIPDDLGYYSHPVSPLRDGPTPGTLVWEWRDLGGPPVVTPEGSAPVPVPPTTPSGLTEAQVQAMIDDSIAEALDTLRAGGLRAHGPINLPVVLESLTSLRCKGDIDVAVTLGQATPPDMTADTPPNAATLVVLRRLLQSEEPEKQ